MYDNCLFQQTTTQQMCTTICVADQPISITGARAVTWLGQWQSQRKREGYKSGYNLRPIRSWIIDHLLV